MADSEPVRAETQPEQAAQTASRLATAIAAHKAGRLEDAISGYRTVLEQVPDHVDALTNLGVALRARGDGEAAIAVYGQALAAEPGHANANYNLGNAYRAIGNNESAVVHFRAAIAAQPGYLDAYANLALTLRDLKRLDEALAAAEAGLRALPGAAKLWANLGAVLWAKAQPESAITAYRRALSLEPNSATAHLDVAQIHYRLGDYVEATRHAERALTLDAGLADAHTVTAKCLTAHGQFENALAQLERAQAIDPGNLTARLNKALTLLLKGELGTGFQAYECRWQLDDLTRPEFDQPRWDGGALEGKRLLLVHEQGLGDVIQAVRYAPMLVERGARVIVQCQPPLVHLLSTAAGVDAVVAEGEPLPAFDIHASMLDLPALLGTEEASIPSIVPYLALPEGSTPEDENTSTRRPLRIGIAWAGKPSHNNDANRSCDLDRFRPLLGIPGTRFYGLQVGPRARDIAERGLGAMITDLSGRIGDFLDTARLVAKLDLVIAVDTAVVHLAGAFARPVWTMLPHAPDWRWMYDRTDSPWYPTMRLYRQPAPRDWTPVVDKIATDLKAMVEARGSGGF